MGNFKRKGPRRDSDRGRRDGPRRDSGRGYRDGPRRDFDRRPREMHKAICSECKKECEVPFKPTEGRDVFCKECFAKKKRY